MNLKIQHHNLDLSPDLERLIGRQSQKIRKLLPTFSSHDLGLHITLEGQPRKKQYRAVLVLTLPQSAFRVQDQENNPKTSILRAFDELLRKIERFKSRLNRKKFWRKPVRTASRLARNSEPAELKAENFCR